MLRTGLIGIQAGMAGAAGSREGKTHKRVGGILIYLISLQVLQGIDKQGLLPVYGAGNDLQPDSLILTDEIQRDQVVNELIPILIERRGAGTDFFQQLVIFRRGGLLRRAGGSGAFTETGNDSQQQRQRRGGGQEPA